MLPDSLAQIIEKAYFTLSRINGAARRSADTQDLSEDLPQVEENLETIRENLAEYADVVDVKQLQMYRVLLADVQEQLGAWRTALAAGSQQLRATQARLDTLTTQLRPTTALPPASTAIGGAIGRLRTKQSRAQALLVRRRHAVTGLQTRVSEAFIQGLELQDGVREQLGRFSRQRGQAELPPLWQPGRIQADERASALARRSYVAQRSLVGYYFREHWDYWAWMVVLAGGFFAWVFGNFRALYRSASAGGVGPLRLTDHRLHYLRPVPVAAALLVVFSLAPFLDLQPPAAYTNSLQLLLLLALTALGWRSWPRPLSWYWVGIVAAFFVLNIAYAQRAPGLGVRWAMLLLNAGAVALGGRFWRFLGQHRLLAGFVRPVAVLFVGLNALTLILPNGDLLSNYVINWTLSNNHIRTELALNLGPNIDLDEARRHISEEILSNPNTLHKIAPEILLNNVAITSYDLKALFWINNIRQEQALKSELLAGIYQRLTAAGIAMR